MDVSNPGANTPPKSTAPKTEKYRVWIEKVNSDEEEDAPTFADSALRYMGFTRLAKMDDIKVPHFPEEEIKAEMRETEKYFMRSTPEMIPFNLSDFFHNLCRNRPGEVGNMWEPSLNINEDEADEAILDDFPPLVDLTADDDSDIEMFPQVDPLNQSPIEFEPAKRGKVVPVPITNTNGASLFQLQPIKLEAPCANKQQLGLLPRKSKGKTAQTYRLLEEMYGDHDVKPAIKIELPSLSCETILPTSSQQVLHVLSKGSAAALCTSSPPPKRSRISKPRPQPVPKKKAEKQTSFDCPDAECPKVYTSKNGLKYHLQHHHLSPEQEIVRKNKLQNPKYACTLCPKRYMNKSGLTYHQRAFDHAKFEADKIKQERNEDGSLAISFKFS